MTRPNELWPEVNAAGTEKTKVSAIWNHFRLTRGGGARRTRGRKCVPLLRATRYARKARRARMSARTRNFGTKFGTDLGRLFLFLFFFVGGNTRVPASCVRGGVARRRVRSRTRGVFTNAVI